ncbi:glycosyltransferase family 4 protein [uncultured Umboniibacter sp.]|uniref:glycosyltransferase n=1 Tax=uncultured Umboniibacter sp. TaxID=1798917 RepID=UPI002626719F|nr:glycosyltransferase family 4 protein [uncultured Umboniibacter sp.]
MKPILIVSPIPSHPQLQGNSQRIFTLAKWLKSSGFPLHFVYYGMEGLTDLQRREMSEFWDEFYYISPNRAAPAPSHDDYYDIDDWFDDKVGFQVSELSKRYDYGSCIVNYVWFSKVLDYLPDSVVKVIDTHDVFGDRHIVAKAAGLEPVWFYTTVELESKGLSRADVVLAIQSEEAAYFELITHRQVIEIGHVIPPTFLPQRNEKQLRIGYLGSANPFNVASIEELEKALNGVDNTNISWCLAGSITRAINNKDGIFENWGFVDSLDDFYREMDIIVNPMVGGTGLKIKSVEALSYGKPLLATPDAMVGINTTAESHLFESLTSLVQFANEYSAPRLVDETNLARSVYQDYCHQQLVNIESLVAVMSR